MLTIERLKEVVSYAPSTGRFVWLQANSACVKVGDEAGSGRDSKGYRRIQIDGVRYRAHRLAWFYMTGRWPPDEIDHKDLDTSNNRWANLRLATRKQNNENRSGWARSGCKGITSHGRKWRARIRHNGVQTHLGLFPSKDAAVAARREAEQRLFTHAI